MPPQGMISFSGIPQTKIVSGSVTLTAGVSPNVATITCVPFPGPYTLRGVLTIRYGGTVINMIDSRLTDVSFQTAESGQQMMSFHIADPRWAWEFGWIRGAYNLREGDQQLRPTREKKPQELAALLFKAMGVKKYDASKLPNDTRPTVDWDGVPAEYLSQLCESLGCKVVYNPLQNRAEIVVSGQGKDLPIGYDVTSDSLDLNPPEVPDSLVFLAGRSEWQWDFELEPVARELDGEIKKLDDVSWKPAGGWERSTGPPWFDDVGSKYRETARRDAWRLYRIKTPVTVFGQKIDTLEQILPILDTLIQTQKINKDATERVPAQLMGRYYDGNIGVEPTFSLKGIDGQEYQWYQRGFSIDTQNGLINASEPLYLHVDQAGNTLVNEFDPLALRYAPAKLFLRTSVNVRDKDTWAWIREKIELKPGGKKLTVEPKYIEREDISRQKYHLWDGKNLTPKDNEKEVKSQADYYLKQELLTWQLQTPGTRSYVGFKQISLDGAISQITWQVDDSGVSTTTISRNQEPPAIRLTYKQKRQRDGLRNLLAKEARGKAKA